MLQSKAEKDLRGAGGVHDEGEIIRSGRNGLILGLLAELDELRVTDEAHALGLSELEVVRLDGLRLVVPARVLIPLHNGLESGALLHNLDDALQLLSRAACDGDLGVVDNVLEGIVAERVIQSHAHHGLRVGSDGGEGPLGAVGRADAHSLALAQAESSETRTHSLDLIEALGVGLPHKVALLVILVELAETSKVVVGELGSA